MSRKEEVRILLEDILLEIGELAPTNYVSAEKYCLQLLQKLRENGINSEIFPESAKMKKQMTYANNKNIPFVVLVGENEMEKGVLNVKDMISGDQSEMKFEELLQKLS